MHPSYFAISLRQLNDIDAKARDILQGAFRECTTRDVVTRVIRPATEESHRGYARYLNEGNVLLAQVFVSHAWDGNFGNFTKAVTSVFNSQKHPLSDPHLWISFTAIWQGGDYRPAVRPGLNPAEGPFGESMARC